MKRFIAFVLLISCILILPACGSSDGLNANADPVDFQSILISRNYCSAVNYVVEAVRTDTGVHLSRYVTYVGDDDPGIQMVYETDDGQETYNRIAAMAGACNIASWDGFHESARNVLDGDSFSLEATLADGTEVRAYGSNAYPKNFFDLEELLDSLLDGEMITGREVTANNMTLTVPEGWVNQVYMHYDPDYTLFEVPLEDGKYSYLFRLDVNTYGYTESDGGRVINVGKMILDGEEYYVSVYIYDYGIATDDELTEEQRSIYKTLERDISEIIETIRGTTP